MVMRYLGTVLCGDVLGWALHLRVVSESAEKSRGLFLVRVFTVRVDGVDGGR